MKLAKELASSSKEVRDKAFEDLAQYLIETAETDELEHMKVWKALYYCFWMSDKPLIQQDLAEQLCGLIHKVDRPVAVQYLTALYKTLVREWYQIDAQRLNKYFMFLRKLHQNTFRWLSTVNWKAEDIEIILNILKSGPLSINNNRIPFALINHTIQSFFVELARASHELDLTPLNVSQAKLLLDPFIQMLYLSDNEKIVDAVLEEIVKPFAVDETETFDFQAPPSILPGLIPLKDFCSLLYEIPFSDKTLHKNKKILKNYLQNWSEKVQVPFVKTIVVTGVDVTKTQIPVDLTSLPIVGKKRKRAENQINKHNLVSIDENQHPTDNSSEKSKAEHKNKSKAGDNKNVKDKIVVEHIVDECGIPSDKVEVLKEYDVRKKSKISITPGTNINRSYSGCSAEEGPKNASKKMKVKVSLEKLSPAPSKKSDLESVISASDQGPVDSGIGSLKAASDLKTEPLNILNSDTVVDVKKKRSKKKSKSIAKHTTEQEPQDLAIKKQDSVPIEKSDNIQTPSLEGNPNSTENVTLDNEIEKKAVSWGPTFFKYTMICNPEEAQKSPVITKTAPKVLKKTNYIPIISKFTIGKRSKRNKRK